MSALETRGLVARYRERVALDGIDLAVDRGERLAVVGPNGSGKTTLVRVLAGLLRPSTGHARLDGRDLVTIPARERARRIAVVAQSFATPFAFTAGEIVALGRTSYVGWFGGLDGADRAAIAEALAEVDASDLAQRPFAELSGGERQRIVLAMALAQQADVLLLDEPTTHLDLAHGLRILELVRDLAVSRRLTVLAVLHDVAVAASHFDRLVVLERGRIAADGPGPETVTASLLGQVFGVRARVCWYGGVATIVPHLSSAQDDRSTG
ncbi:MAG TPA: ABC transporter ATP-binding protein [Candidatus Limnocylindria bacterium]|nr:ABC transporter ATP-binding protein [Candidatus Limnocylindria bacterium]